MNKKHKKQKIISLKKAKKRKKKNGPGSIDELLFLMRKDVDDLLTAKELVEPALHHLATKALKKPSSQLAQDWLQLQRRIPSLRFIRYLSTRTRAYQEDILEKLNLDEQDELVVARWLRVYGAVLKDVLTKTQRIGEGRRNAWERVDLLGMQVEDEVLINLRIIADEQDFETLDSCTSLIYLAATIIKSVEIQVKKCKVPSPYLEEILSALKKFKSSVTAFQQFVRTELKKH